MYGHVKTIYFNMCTEEEIPSIRCIYFFLALAQLSGSVGAMPRYCLGEGTEQRAVTWTERERERDLYNIRTTVERR